MSKRKSRQKCSGYVDCSIVHELRAEMFMMNAKLNKILTILDKKESSPNNNNNIENNKAIVVLPSKNTAPDVEEPDKSESPVQNPENQSNKHLDSSNLVFCPTKQLSSSNQITKIADILLKEAELSNNYVKNGQTSPATTLIKEETNNLNFSAPGISYCFENDMDESLESLRSPKIYNIRQTKDTVSQAVANNLRKIKRKYRKKFRPYSIKRPNAPENTESLDSLETTALVNGQVEDLEEEETVSIPKSHTFLSTVSQSLESTKYVGPKSRLRKKKKGYYDKARYCTACEVKLSANWRSHVASRHLKAPALVCNVCQYEARWHLNNMKFHFGTHHQGLEIDFIDKREELKEEIDKIGAEIIQILDE